jgi:DNA-binding response OmpR family regulator
MSEGAEGKGAGEPGANTVMVIEPDILARMVIADYLRNCGYKVIEGVVAEDVFAVLNAGGAIDMIFSEVKLPGELDGFGLASKIRESHSHIDVLLSRGTANAAEKAGDLCEDGPLEKPYHPQEVLRRINVLRERRRTTKKPL